MMNDTEVLASENTHHSYEIAIDLAPFAEHRWIGRCKQCGVARKIEGQLLQAPNARTNERDFVVLSTDDRVYMTDDRGTNPYAVTVRCGDHWHRLRRVTEGKKNSKHECNARCLASTGPACDCKCKGKNHGSSL
jgi:hypothetical protein